MNLTGKGDDLANVRHAGDPGNGPLESEPEARMDEGPILSEVEVPAVPLRI